MVVVAVDWSAESRRAVECAVQLAERGDARLAMLHVRERNTWTYGEDLVPTEVIQNFEEEAETKASSLLKKYSEIATKKNVRSEGFYLKGDVRETIVREAEAMEADLLVLGSRGLGVLQEALLGSVSLHCLHHATCPVLIVRGQEGQEEEEEERRRGKEREEEGTRKEEKRKKQILIGVDESEPAKEAFRWALRHVCEPEKCHVTLLMASPLSTFPFMELLSEEETKFLESQAEKEKQKFLGFLEREALNMGISTSTRVEVGDARDVICDVTEEVKADLVILGSRGLGSFSSIVLGSVSSFCSHHVNAPLLVVRSRNSQKKEKKKTQKISAVSAHLE